MLQTPLEKLSKSAGANQQIDISQTASAQERRHGRLNRTSSNPFEEGHLEFTKKWLSSLGLNYKIGKYVFESYSDLAGTDEQRLEDFHAMWADKEVDAVFPIRGGNGSVRLLPKLDFDLIAKNPKIFIGYSDITGLLIPIHQRTGLVTFHGPTAGSFFEAAYTFHHFRKAVMSVKPIGTVSDPPEVMWKPKYPPTRLVIRGHCSWCIDRRIADADSRVDGYPF